VGHRPRRWLASVLVAASAAVAPTVGPAVLDAPSVGAPLSATTTTGNTAVSVIVQAHSGHWQEAAAAVRAAGGQLGRGLPIVEGFAARLPASAVRRLAADPAIRRITPDSHVGFSMAAAPPSTAAAGDAPIASSYPRSTGATAAWAGGNRGDGVTVAVIDTGISPVPDLAGRLLAGPDFSGERNSLRDSYGHGTVMAGIIAGDGTSSSDGPTGAYVGMAPGARVLSVKVAGRDGATDVSTVLAAMQWVASYQSVHHIKVVNLAWGTTSDQSPSVDPLNYAVQRLWRAGIVTVAAAGNDGPASNTIAKPGDDPAIITAGAYDDRQNTALTDDVVTAWSARGPTAAGSAKPDVIAPGRTLIATRAPGSRVEIDNAQAHVGSNYIRGSGTSQASAVVAGSVALLLGHRGGLSPDQIKHAITSSAVPINGATAGGHGRISVPGMLQATVDSAPKAPLTGSGLGSLEASRGGRHVETQCAGDIVPTRISGEMDVLCRPWHGGSWTGAPWTVASWGHHTWSGESWTRASWTRASWTGDSWTGGSWTGDTWTGTGMLTAFWGSQTLWWQRLPGETAATRAAEAAAIPGADR